MVGDGDSLVRVPPFPIRTRDSTGAGDSFAAGLIVGYLGGLSWQSAGVLANALGALAASRVGGGAAQLHALEIVALLQQKRRRPTHRSSAEAVQQAIALLESRLARTEEEAPS